MQVTPNSEEKKKELFQGQEEQLEQFKAHLAKENNNQVTYKNIKKHFIKEEIYELNIN